MSDNIIMYIAIGSVLTIIIILGILLLRLYKIKSSNNTLIALKNEIEQLNNEISALNSNKEAVCSEINEFKKNIESLSAKIIKLQKDKDKLNKETQALQTLKENEAAIRNEYENLNKQIADIKSKIASLKPLELEAKEQIQTIQAKVDLYCRIDEFAGYGHYEIPQYLYETSDRFVIEIKSIRELQKEMIKEGSVIISTARINFPVEGKFLNKILEEQKKLMIRSFNIECDLLIEKVNPSNVARILERIGSIANSIEKSCADLRYGFSIEYINLKFEECRLQYQYTLKKKEEIEEQRAIREQIREEEKARREYENALAEAEKEENMYKKMLEKAQEALSSANDEERAAAELRIKQLEGELAEAKAKAERAKSMAEQTRKGHVYIISNIGSFGDDVYKIGLTRRLDPTERVKELGDASVPFSFDIHAMIYSEDAPKLETDLHKSFHLHRVNAVNFRKEFFHVSLEKIQEAVHELAGSETEFKTTIIADEYFQTKRLREAE